MYTIIYSRIIIILRKHSILYIIDTLKKHNIDLQADFTDEAQKSDNFGKSGKILSMIALKRYHIALLFPVKSFYYRHYVLSGYG
jgi:hypothetical protein